MKLNKFIQQLLLDNEMVIIPGFGAFIQEYQPAEIIEDSGEIKPPSTHLTFNAQIRNNDGLLVGHVAENTRDSHFEALQKIEKERDNWLYQLDKGEKVTLSSIGTFSNNEKGELVFISEEDQKHSLESFGLETTSLQEPEEIEPVQETEEVPAEPEGIKETDAINEEMSEPESEEIQQDKPAETVEIESSEEVQEEAPEVITEEKEDPAKKEEEKIPEPVATIPQEPGKEKKRKGGWWWLLLILIPLIAVAVFLLMKEKKPAAPVKTTPPAEVNIQEARPAGTNDSIQADSTISVLKDSLTVSEPEPKKTELSDTTGFFLVGGSFKAEENAETYLQQLKAQGYEPFHLGKYGNFYIVGIGRYNTEREALKAKDEYAESNPGSGVWVLEK